jgi:hypothetical protein
MVEVPYRSTGQMLQETAAEPSGDDQLVRRVDAFAKAGKVGGSPSARRNVSLAE